MNLGLTPRTYGDIDENNSLSIESLIQFQERRSDQRGQSEASVVLTPSFGDERASSTLHSLLMTINSKLKHRLSDAIAIEPKLSGSYTNRRVKSLYTARSADGDPDPELDRRSVLRSTEAGLTAGLAIMYDANEKVQWKGGLEVARTRYDDSMDQLEAIAGQGGNLRTVEVAGSTARRRAYYAQTDIKPTELLGFSFGVRVESYSYDASVQGDDLGDARTVERYRVVVPSAQAVWRFRSDRKDQVRFNLSKGVRLPSRRELLQIQPLAGLNSPLNPMVKGNALLRPEQAWSAMGAYEMYWGSGEITSVEVYSKRLQDIIVQRVSLQDGYWTARPENRGEATIRGVALEHKAALNRVVSTAPPITVKLGLGFAQSRFEGADHWLRDHVGQQAKRYLVLGGDYQVPGGAYNVGLDYRFDSEVRSRPMLATTARTSPRKILDGYVSGRFDKGATWRVVLSNLLAKSTKVATLYSSPDAAAYQYDVAPSYRSIRLTWDLSI